MDGLFTYSCMFSDVIHWSFGKYYANFQMLTNFIIQLHFFKNTFVNITNWIRKTSMYWRLSNTQWQMQVFQNSKFDWKFQLLSLAVGAVSCFLSSDSNPSFHLKGSVCQIPSLILMVCVSLLRKHGVLWGAWLCWLPHVNKGESAFPRDIPDIQVCRNTLCYCPPHHNEY